MLNADTRSSLVASEKATFERLNTTMPMVRDTVSLNSFAAQALTASVPPPITRPAMASQARSFRDRRGSLDGRGFRSMRPSAGLP